MNNDKDTTNNTGIGELDPIKRSSSLSPTRTYASPLMGTSARSAKRRLDGDIGPVLIDGTDTYNQQLQHHYQNIRHAAEDQQPGQISNVDQSNESGQSFSTKRDFFEQHFKSSPSPYDSPPQKVITTITTTTSTTPTTTLLNRASLPLNESSPSINHLLEQAAELQKLHNAGSNKDNSQQSLVIERTEQYQVYLDRTNHATRGTSPVSISKTGHATDIDQAQAEADRLADDHQAIQQLTRVLQEHHITPTTTNQYKRLSLQTNPILINQTTTTTTTIPTDIALVDRTNKTKSGEFTVIDALLDNPLGTNNTKQNETLHKRFNSILSSLHNSEYVNALKQSITRERKTKKSKTQLAESPNSKEKKKQDKENKKKNKKKSKQLPKFTEYHVINAIINNPISLPVPDSYLRQFTVSSPVSQLSFKQADTKANNETGSSPVKVADELMLHHATPATASVPRTTRGLQQTVKPTYLNDIVYQQRPIRNTNQFQTPIKPRIIYRYIDEQGNVLKYSSTPPSQLHEVIPEKQSQQNSYQNIEPTYFHSRQIVTDNNHRHLLPVREGRTPWQDESKLLKTTTTREDLELRDKHKSQISEQLSPTTRTIPRSIEREHAIRTPSQQQYHYPNQKNVTPSWLPLSYQLGERYIPNSAAGYDTDSTSSENSAAYRTYDYAPVDPHYRSNNRPLVRHDYHHSRSPDRTNYPSPPPFAYVGRSIPADYNANDLSRNYIEIFRDGESKPSEIYSLPLNEPVITGHRHSRYDKHQAEKSGKNHVPSFPKHEKIIPSSHDESYYPHTVQNNPNQDYIHFDNYSPQAKSSDYRPLRTKLQREYKITPSLLVDEWDHPEQSVSTDYTKLSSISSPDDVFINNNRTNKA